MSAVVELRLGDLFDGPADLIVLPCSTGGTITRFVAERLLQYSIPTPKRGMAHGETHIVPFTGAENIAQFVAFAASVDGINSSADAIEAIGTSVGEFTRANESIRNISAPLLGAGAGGLQSELVVDALTRGFRKSASDSARLVIHVLHQSVFDRLQGVESPSKVTSTPPESPQRVFISYSGTSDRHNEWVAALGTFLRANGIDARLDQWHLRKGMDLPQWMTNELELAERVVIVSDSRYRDRADKRSGGVGWETMLIQGDMAQQPPDSRKYLIVVREEQFKDGIPNYLKTKFSIHWSSTGDEGKLRDDLLKELYDVELAPPIGAPPSLYVAG
ncbi:TIR domain-containing protein [Stieleria sp. JC731]|uniref:SEFIR domain-containing protein n=1 Tax=Pirellulaceae TaxID=2691357 RepID=UPI001E51765C|nr:SEFIR domain-containing protein [Stieleria sp. JC731]MCC9600549.1 TIR domain-containing protein [Stieleria sp. JC731]